jgi:hypothetical protein
MWPHNRKKIFINKQQRKKIPSNTCMCLYQRNGVLPEVFYINSISFLNCYKSTTILFDSAVSYRTLIASKQ